MFPRPSRPLGNGDGHASLERANLCALSIYGCLQNHVLHLSYLPDSHSPSDWRAASRVSRWMLLAHPGEQAKTLQHREACTTPPAKRGALRKQETNPALGRGPREESREHVRRQPMMLALQHIWRSVGQVIRPADSFGIVLTLLLLNYLAITIEHTAPWVRVIVALLQG